MADRGLVWVQSDGGRAAAGFSGHTGDCTCRAIALATGRPYQEVYDYINAFCRKAFPTSGISKHSARTGIPTPLVREVMEALGATWTPTMKVGQGCTVHLRPDELPKGRLVVRLSRHLAAVVDRVVYDTYDPCRDGERCVYGYWIFPDLEKPTVSIRLVD